MKILSFFPNRPTAMQLNRADEYASEKQNLLCYCQGHTLLDGLPVVITIEKMPGIDDQARSVESRARAYLDVNCGTCHHP